ncbi:oligopeptide ABC transporter permease [Bacillus sp. CGMCC 1.16607]|uniref:oligopeptide ABC transporter permease n=1 Tax=Bacillus sp. CGMCC 1.16607 TaxID=3351842 RepID=UPI003628EDE4
MGVPNPSVNSPIQIKTPKTTEQDYKIESKATVIWRRFRKNKLAVAGLIVFLIMCIISIFAPLLTPFRPDVYDILDQFQAPSKKHIMGTDSMGGDIWTRIVFGGRISLSVALLAMVCTVSIGIIYGAVSGYFGGFVDNMMMRIVDAIQSIPTFFLLLIVAALITPSLWSTVLVLSAFGWTGMARIVRGEILSIKKRDYVEAARATGEKKFSTIFYHVLPNAIAPITVIATLDIAANILAEASLSFLGLGIQPPTPSWGNMLTSAQELTTVMDYIWIVLFPGTFIIVTVLAVNFMGDGLRDALDPRMKE